jgi:hypothetical protein
MNTTPPGPLPWRLFFYAGINTRRRSDRPPRDRLRLQGYINARHNAGYFCAVFL